MPIRAYVSGNRDMAGLADLARFISRNLDRSPERFFFKGGAIACVSAELCPMTTAFIRSFEPDQGLVHVLLVGTLSEATLRVCGSDRSVVARLPPGEPIQFQLVRDRHGRECAIDIESVRTLTIQ
jgi:hypothetical protein